MSAVRYFTGADGRTHWEELESLSRYLAANRISLQPTEQIGLRRYANHQDVDWHNCPRRQLVFVLSGEVDYEIGDGTRRRFPVGSVLLFEDTTGQGHVTRHFGDFCAAVVPLE